MSKLDPQQEAALKKLRLIGAWAAFVAVVAIVVGAFWLMRHYPRF